jgi:phenylalanyl-tRNA synthetase alpha chain
VDIWRVRQGAPFLRREALISLIETVLSATFPGAKYRANETEHPYTVCGLEVEVQIGDHWLEILECGEVNPRILLDAGLPPSEWSGLAMGIGLDRLVMITKSIDDIRLLRAMDKRIARQMTDLEPYIPVSKYPSIRHDLSVAVDEATQPEDVAEVVRGALGRDCDVLEEVVIVSETKYADLHPAAIERLGMSPSQKNLLVRITFRSHERSLVQGEANVFRDRVYDALHKGSKKLYASR